MTLRATPKDINVFDSTQKIETTLKISKFTQMITRVQKYLQMILKFSDWGSTFSPNGSIPIGCPIILVGRINESNPYVNAFRDIFEYKCELRGEYGAWRNNIYKVEFAKNSWWSKFIQSDCENLDKLERILHEIEMNDETEYSIAWTKVKGSAAHICNKKDLQYYIVFWNLFLVTLDDDTYTEQLPVIADLAYYFGFDEHMMRDWCRAVEYVLSGNHLSETCDLHCDTVEGAKFFLHSEDEDEKQRRLESEQVLELLQ